MKGEYKYIPMFAFRRFGGHGWVCVHTSGHAWRGWIPACYGLIAHKENGRKQRRNLDARRVGQQDGDGGEELVVLNGEEPALSEREDFFHCFLHSVGRVIASTLLAHVMKKEGRKASQLPGMCADIF